MLRQVDIVLPLLSLALAGCGGHCGGGPQRGSGDFATCQGRTPEEFEDRKVGTVQATMEDGELRLTGPEPLEVSAFVGPAPGSIEQLDPAGAHLLVVLGNVGDELPSATKTLRALAGTGVLTLLISGARDRPSVIEDALDSLGDQASSIIWLDGVRRVQVGGAELIPVPGTLDGRYAFCGYSADDLSDLADELGAADGVPRWLIAHSAPTGAAGRGLLGVDAGDPEVARLAERIGARGGLFAWPSEQAGRVLGPDDRLQMVLAPVGGPAAVRADGTVVAPGATQLRLEGGILRSVSGGMAAAPSTGAEAPTSP